MRIRGRGAAGVFGAAALGAALWTGGAEAQSVVGCFVNGRQVADSLCQPGGGASPSMPANPSAAAVNAMGAALGASMGAAIRNMMEDKPDPAAAQRAAEREAQDRAALRSAMDAKSAEERRRREEQEEQSREFAARQRDLATQVHSLGGDSSSAPLQIRETLNDAPNDPAPARKPDPEPGTVQEIPAGWNCYPPEVQDNGAWEWLQCADERGRRHCFEKRGDTLKPIECR